MEIIFLGGFFPEQFLEYILNNSKLQVQNSANNFQWAFIKGIERNFGKPITLITAPYIGWFPKYYKQPFLKTAFFTNNEVPNSGIMVGFCNLPLVKNIFKYFNLTKHLKRRIINDQPTTIIVYSLDIAYLKSAIRIKKLFINVKVCVIIPDLHEFPGDAGFLYKLYIKYIEKPAFYNVLNQIDAYVVLTDKMVSYLNIRHKPWIRIEGLYENNNNLLNNSNKNNSDKIVLYTGTLDYKYGIISLLDAFNLITDENYKLWICGGGPGENLVKQKAIKDKRIIYWGIVNRNKIAELQSQATILVNPRNDVGEYNKYSFPSKTMEYLASGTPALIYKLDGIPAEYFNYCYTIEGDGIHTLAESIYNTCQLNADILKIKGQMARDFILKEKNSDVQCNKVLLMLKQLI